MATTWTNKTSGGVAVDAFILEIGEGYNLLLDTTYKLQIQAATTETSWSNESKN